MLIENIKFFIKSKSNANISLFEIESFLDIISIALICSIMFFLDYIEYSLIDKDLLFISKPIYIILIAMLISKLYIMYLQFKNKIIITTVNDGFIYYNIIFILLKNIFLLTIFCMLTFIFFLVYDLPKSFFSIIFTVFLTLLLIIFIYYIFKFDASIKNLLTKKTLSKFKMIINNLSKENECYIIFLKESYEYDLNEDHYHRHCKIIVIEDRVINYNENYCKIYNIKVKLDNLSKYCEEKEKKIYNIEESEIKLINLLDY